MNKPIYPLSSETFMFFLLTVKRAHESVSEATVFNPTATTFNCSIWFCAGHLTSWSISFLSGKWLMSFTMERRVPETNIGKHKYLACLQNIWSFPSSFCFSFIFFQTLEKNSGLRVTNIWRKWHMFLSLSIQASYLHIPISSLNSHWGGCYEPYAIYQKCETQVILLMKPFTHLTIFTECLLCSGH